MTLLSVAIYTRNRAEFESGSVSRGGSAVDRASETAFAAMRKLVELFSDPSLASKAQFRCCVDGLTEFEVLFESIADANLQRERVTTIGMKR